MKLHSAGLVLCAIAIASAIAPAARANETTADIISAALFEQSGDIYRNRGIDRQATLLFGLSFPEHEYFNDAQKVERLYREGMRQQGANDGVVRTADLPNPFDTSIRTNPAIDKPSFGGGTAKGLEPEAASNPKGAPYNEVAPRARG
jgi:hypothetical protein